MYVFCVGMYRACSTWQYEVAAHLLTAHRGGRRLGYLTGEEFAAYDDAEGRPTEGWYVLKSHEEHPRFRAALAEGRAIALYAHRDLRDVVDSLMHKRRLDFDALLTQGMIHQVLANDRFWTARPHVLVQRYDRLMADPVSGVAEIARFLGLRLDPSAAEAVAAEYSLEANRRRTQTLGNHLRSLGVDLDDPANAQYSDRETLLHWNHLRDGRTGGWRDRVDDRQRVILARLANPWLRAHGYEPDTPPGPPSLRDRVQMARGWLACRLRCLALRHPGPAGVVKALLGLPPAPNPHAAPLKVVPPAAGPDAHEPAAEPESSRRDAA